MGSLVGSSQYFFVPGLFEEKRGDIVFGFLWFVVRGSEFIISRYLVSATPPTGFNQSFGNFTGVFIVV